MTDYTIMEYNIDTRSYTAIGIAEGIDGKQAKENYIKKHGWEPRDGIYLFAKPPLCRYTLWVTSSVGRASDF